jgi:hypothetical protein
VCGGFIVRSSLGRGGEVGMRVVVVRELGDGWWEG